MKKCLAVMLILIFVLPFHALCDKSAALFPAYDGETQAWGYIDSEGNWAIPPQYAYAEIFRGRYAAVSTGDPWDYTMGIIDEKGNWMVEPHYFVDSGYDEAYYGGLNVGIWQVWKENLAESNLMGFFDVPSGYFSGLVVQVELGWVGPDRLMPVTLLDVGDCYVDRRDGSVAFEIPKGLWYDWLTHGSDFHDGFALLWDDDETLDIGEERKLYLVSEQGKLLNLGRLQFGERDYACGLLRAYDPESGALGYYDPAKEEWRIKDFVEKGGMQYRLLQTEPFSGNGYACVYMEDSYGKRLWGHVDTRGNVLFDLGYVTWNSKFGYEKKEITEPYTFFGDYAWIEEANVMIDPIGQVVLAIPEGWQPHVQDDDELDDAKDYYFSPGGVIELLRKTPLGNEENLMTMDGEWLLDPETYTRNWGQSTAVELHRFFSEGLQAVRKIVGVKEWKTVHGKDGDRQEPVYETKVGYVNEKGEVVVDFLYEDGGAFMNGLAMVQMGNQVGYINSEGREIFFWTEK